MIFVTWALKGFTMKKVIKYSSNFYVLATLSFLVWMIFIDSNNLPTHWRLTKQLWELEEQKEFYKQKKVQIQQERKELFGNPELLEKIAREKYLMKKPTEDLYVVVEK
jgi:cell division protein FtsB